MSRFSRNILFLVLLDDEKPIIKKRKFAETVSLLYAELLLYFQLISKIFEYVFKHRSS